MVESRTPVIRSQKRISSRVTRAQLKRSMHERYRNQLHYFYNASDLRRSRANGQSTAKTKNGFSLIVPPTDWLGLPPKVMRDPKRPPYSRAQRREMHHGVYKW